MNIQSAHDSVPWRTAFYAYAREYVLCFVLLSMILAWRQTQVALPGAHWLIRTGMLQDLVAELPTGRQAAVSSLSFMPLTLIAALPFLPVLPPSAYGYAYLYGLAMLLALVVHPLNVVLNDAGARRLRGTAILLPVFETVTLDPARHGDLMACLSMLSLALFFERRRLPEVRAMAGVFWGLTLFAHAAGLVLLALRLLFALARRVRTVPGAEAAAVRWVQTVCAAYMILVYLFLNWMIMGHPLYPMRTLGIRALVGDRFENPAGGLAEDLPRFGLDAVPVVSGHWGYLIRPLLEAREGYHVFDVHPDKLPEADRRDLVLVVPTPTNPLSALADWPSAAPFSRRRPSPHLLLGQSRDWAFYLIDRPPPRAEFGESTLLRNRKKKE